jgi:hypothetical protein
MTAPFIHCYQAMEKLGKTTESSSADGTVSVKFIYKEADINYGKREYQREVVADLDFKQGILRTVLDGQFRKIPQIHIRVITIRTENVTYLQYELVDGQQRVTSITQFLDGLIPLPKAFIVGGQDIGGLYASELKNKYLGLYTKILDYRISCVWYENISDIQTAELFVEVLNKTNDMKPQEIRNAIAGLFSTWCRDTARGNPDINKKPHKLLERTADGKMKLFGDWTLRGRMEVDEWLSELSYMKIHGWKSGVTQVPHTKWVKNIQRPGGVYESKFGDEKDLLSLLNFGYTIIKASQSDYKKKLSPMLSQVLILYANDLKEKYGKIIPAKYVKAFFKVYNDWSCVDKKLYMNELTQNGNQMKEFSSLFGGKNSNALGTICYVLDKEMTKDISSFGIIEMDQRVSFSDEDIYKKWKEQGMKDGYTGDALEFEDAVGDHYIPRSEGVKLGGVTEYDNLIVTSDVNNRIKSNMNPESFKEQVA